VSSPVLPPEKYTSTRYSQRDLERVLATADGHVLVPTSGSTGEPKQVVVSARALTASGQATYRALAGPGQWLLALEPTHIAGIQVLARSVLADQPCVAMGAGHFSSEGFVAACAQLQADIRYTSLVPTQLHRLLSIDQPASVRESAVAALRGFAAVLVGGAASSAALLAQARSEGIAVVTTYGMSETAGGCVYDGAPLDVAQVRVDSDGRVYIAGPMLADGYLASASPQDAAGLVAQVGPPAAHRVDCSDEHPTNDLGAFVISDDSTRWHRTNDLGVLTASNTGPEGAVRLEILGRADDVILSGGLNIAPRRVEDALVGSFGIEQAVVVGVADAEWGARVVAVVTRCAESEIAPLEHIRAVLTSRLGVGYAPRHIVVVDALPLTASGKPDRLRIKELAQARAN